MFTKLFILLVIHDFMETAVVFRRVCSYCRDKEVYQLGRNYVGFYQKENTGPLESYPCARDPGNLMKCSTSCVQAQIIRKDTGETFTYRDCGTYLLQEFGQEKINLSYTQYAMILTDTDDIGNTWVFKFCNKEKCLHPSDYNIDYVEEEKGNAVADVEASEKACADNDASNLLLIGLAVVGVIAAVALLMKAYSKWTDSRERRGTGNNRVSARMNMNGEQRRMCNIF